MRYLAGVSTLRLDAELCTGCGVCAQVCPHGVIQVEGKKARIMDMDACMECGACAKNCPPQALAVTPGVGCAYAILRGMIQGGPADCGPSGPEPCCGPSDKSQ